MPLCATFSHQTPLWINLWSGGTHYFERVLQSKNDMIYFVFFVLILTFPTVSVSATLLQVFTENFDAFYEEMIFMI